MGGGAPFLYQSTIQTSLVKHFGTGTLPIETGGHLLKEDPGARFDFWFCRFHCLLYRDYVSSVPSAVSPALHMFSNCGFHNPVRAWVVT